MYRGKFDSKYKNGGAPVTPQSTSNSKKDSAPATEPAKPARQATKQQTTSRQAQPQRQAQAQPQRQAQAQPQRQTQAQPQRQTQAQAQPQRQTQAQPQQRTVRQSTPQPAPQAAPARRGPRIGGVIFYTFYFLFIFLFFVGTYLGLNWLNGWLVDFEAAQPTTQSQEYFEKLFSDPDWSALYDMADIEDTPYEGKDAVVAYLENKVGDSELNMVETSTGLSTDKKYYVRLGDERVASFTLTGGNNDMTEIPDWKLGAVELFFERNESYLIQKLDGHTATVNGVALTDDFTIQISTTTAEEYLPIDVVGTRTCIQKIDGLIAMPEVKVTDAQGNEVEVVYDEATRTFVEQTEVNTITTELENVAIDACKAYSMYMIEAVGANQVAKYFDTTSNTYKNIVRSERWMQDYSDYRFGNEQVSNYCRYTDDLFSAKVSLSLYVTRTNGTVREYKVDDTLFFELQDTGKWLVFDKTNEDVTAPVEQVRLTFIVDGETVSSEFYNAGDKEMTIPVPAAPSGKVFTGWYRKDVNESGTTTATVIFSPDENGHVATVGVDLEPMTLYALFQTAEDAATTTAAASQPAETTATTEEGAN